MRADHSGRVLGGRYRLKRILGTGGMGVVYEAWQEDLGRSVAVKLMTGASPDALPRFRREARAAAALGHPHIVQVFDFQASEGQPPYIVMELVEGRSLRDVVRSEGPLDERRVARLGIQVLSALGAAHGVGIVHRDIKPANVLVTTSQTLGESAKVLDFGIAKLLDSNAAPLTQHGSVIGTLAYMSPEQARGDALDGRSDVYSLAATLFFACTGERALNGSESSELYMALLAGDVRRAEEVRPGLDPELSAIIGRGLALDPSARFGSAIEMAEALQAWLEGSANSGRRPAAPASFGPGPTAATGMFVPESQPTATSVSTSLRVDPTLPLPPAPPKRSRSVAVTLMVLAGVGVVLLGGAAALAAGAYYFYSEPSAGSAAPAPRAAAGTGGSAATSQAVAANGSPSAVAATTTAPAVGPKAKVAAPAAKTSEPAVSVPAPSSEPSPAPQGGSSGAVGAPCSKSSDCKSLSYCSGGKCACSNTVCSGACVDTQRDVNHCGGCGKACASGQFCMTGSCTNCAGPTMAVCNGVCLVTVTNRNNCGGCGIKCKPGKPCVGGKCQE